MADSSIDVTPGTGASIDTRTEAGGDHRQVVVIGDPTTTAGVAPVDGTNGLAVDVKTSVIPTGAATEATLESVKTAVETLDNAISGSEMQVDVVASLPAGTNAIGKLAANSGVDIGDVDVTSIVPGTAASNLGKAEDAAHSSGDTGVMLLAVRQDDASSISDTDGDYSPLTVSEHSCLNVDPQHYLSLDDCDATTGWSVLGNDTDNLTTATNHVWKTASLSFDKVDGADNTVIAGIQKTVSSVSVNKFIEEGGGFFLGSIFMTSLADVDYVFFRAGTDSSNYNEWRVSADNLDANQWNALRGAMAAPYASTGNGWNSSAVTWIAIGAAFDGQNDTLAAILVDGIFANSGLQTSADITSQVSTSVSSPNVNVKKWGASNVTVDQGNSDSGTLRVAIANDDTNLAIIAGDTTSIDGKITACNTGAIAGTVTAELSAVDNAVLDTIAGDTTSLDGKVTACNTGAIAGTVTAELSAVDNAVLDTIAGDTTSLDGKVTACNTGAVTISAALPAGTNAIGKLAANSGVDIGDVDVTSLPASTNTLEVVGDVADDAVAGGNPVAIGGLAKEQDGSDPGSVAEGDCAAIITDRNRRVYVNTAHPNLWDASDAQSTPQTNTALKAAPGANLSLYITDIIVSNGATAGTIKFVEDTAGTPVDVVELLYLGVNAGAPISLTTPIKITANKDFGYTSASVTTHSVTVTGYIAP